MYPLLWGHRAFWALGNIDAVMPATMVEVQYPRMVDTPANATPRYNTRYTEGYNPVRLVLEVPIWYPMPDRLSVFAPTFVAWAFPQPHTDYQAVPALPIYLHHQTTTRVFMGCVAQSVSLRIIKNETLTLQIQCLAAYEASPITGGSPRWANWNFNYPPQPMSYRNVVFLTAQGSSWGILQGAPIYECGLTFTRHTRPVALITPDPIGNASGSMSRIDATQMSVHAHLRFQARDPNPFNLTAFAFGVRIGDASQNYMEIRIPRMVPTTPYDSTYQRGPMFRTVQCEGIGYGTHPPALVIT